MLPPVRRSQRVTKHFHVPMVPIRWFVPLTTLPRVTTLLKSRIQVRTLLLSLTLRCNEAKLEESHLFAVMLITAFPLNNL